MRRILKMLARLYPAGWRERYGAEYEALIEDATPQVRDGFDILWEAMKMRMTMRSFVRILLPCAVAGMLVAVAISFSRPALYRSRTLIMVDTDDRRSIDKQLQGLVQGSLAQPFLSSLIQQEDLYPSERVRLPMSEVVQSMRKDIWIRRVQTGNRKTASAFTVEFAYPDPHVAQRVDSELVSGLMGLNLREAIANPTAASGPRTTFAVRDAADLPLRPFFPRRGEFGAGGLLIGLVGGLIWAGVNSRRHPIELAAENQARQLRKF